MRNQHVWKSTGPNGERREVRAEKFGGHWRIQARSEGDPAWTYYDTPLLDDLRELHNVLFRKYQRKRLPYEDVASIEKLIRDRGGEIPAHE